MRGFSRELSELTGYHVLGSYGDPLQTAAASAAALLLYSARNSAVHPDSGLFTRNLNLMPTIALITQFF